MLPGLCLSLVPTGMLSRLLMMKTEVTHEHARNFHMGDMAVKVVVKCSV
jgi:hypothetical protein